MKLFIFTVESEFIPIFKLLIKWDIVFNDDKDTLTNWCNRVDQLYMVTLMDVYVNENLYHRSYHQYI